MNFVYSFDWLEWLELSRLKKEWNWIIYKFRIMRKNCLKDFGMII